MHGRRHLLLAAASLILPLFGQPLFGQPLSEQRSDLSGYWSNVTLTPLQRPTELAGKTYFTPEEAAAFERATIAQHKPEATPDSLWSGRVHVVSTLRTSLIIDPPNGRLPRSTQAALRRAGEARAARREHPADGPENRSLSERCLLSPPAGPPMLPDFDTYQIVQSEDYVAIASETMHEARVIPIGDSPHLPGNVRQWLGDSRGHWEGGTLVVDTTNFTNKTTIEGSSQELHLIERLTRTAPDTILYQFTVDDPSAFTAPWTAEIPMHAATGPLAEYACQETNQGLLRILSGARKQEAESNR